MGKEKVNTNLDSTFEQNFKKLEDIVEKLENEEISIDEALTFYEQGINLSKLCIKKLEDARQKVEVLSKESSGNFKLEPFKQESEE